MVNLSKEEAKVALIAMTKDVMQFDANRGLKGEDNKPSGALVFRENKDGNAVRGAYVKIADAAGYDVTSFESFYPRSSKATYEIYDEKLVKEMCGYCSNLGRSRT